MSKILITGSAGMVGSHLIEYLSEHSQNTEIIATYFNPTINLNELIDGIKLIECDVRYFTPFYEIIKGEKPQVIYHLAAQSYPAVSWDRPAETLEINGIGTINLFEAIKMVQREVKNYSPVVIVACSSAEYGKTLESVKEPIKEEEMLIPLHPYGISKVVQDMLSYQYFINDGIKAIRARIFNTTGPRKVNDVCSDFTKQVVLMEKGIKDKILNVGNINTYRAITDVRDLVRALILLSNMGKYGEVYNISGNKVYQISDIITILKSNTNVNFEIKVDKNLLRKTDEKIIYGNSEKLIEDTKWTQKYTLEETIIDMLNYWREKIV